MSKLVGMTGGGAAFQGNKFGPDFSTNPDDLNSGFDKVTPQDPGKGHSAGNLDDGLAGDGSIRTSMPSDLAGPHGFLMDTGNQNIMTDVNASATTKASPTYEPFSDKLVTQTGVKTGHDSYSKQDGDTGINMDDTKASSDY